MRSIVDSIWKKIIRLILKGYNIDRGPETSCRDAKEALISLMFGGHISTEIPITWMDWWVDKKVTERSNARLLRRLNTDFTEEKNGGGGRI